MISPTGPLQKLRDLEAFAGGGILQHGRCRQPDQAADRDVVDIGAEQQVADFLGDRGAGQARFFQRQIVEGHDIRHFVDQQEMVGRSLRALE